MYPSVVVILLCLIMACVVRRSAPFPNSSVAMACLISWSFHPLNPVRCVLGFPFASLVFSTFSKVPHPWSAKNCRRHLSKFDGIRCLPSSLQHTGNVPAMPHFCRLIACQSLSHSTRSGSIGIMPVLSYLGGFISPLEVSCLCRFIVPRLRSMSFHSSPNSSPRLYPVPSAILIAAVFPLFGVSSNTRSICPITMEGTALLSCFFAFTSSTSAPGSCFMFRFFPASFVICFTVRIYRLCLSSLHFAFLFFAFCSSMSSGSTSCIGILPRSLPSICLMMISSRSHDTTAIFSCRASCHLLAYSPRGISPLVPQSLISSSSSCR